MENFYYFILKLKNFAYYNSYVEEVGSFDINPSSFFHFININSDNYNRNFSEFDFENFRIIGFETYLEDYLQNKNINNFNHWLYGPCDNKNIIPEISPLINEEEFERSACIKKYYDIKEKRYIDINDSYFRWPVIEKGTVNFTNKFYSFIIEKCKEDTLNQILMIIKNVKMI